MDYTTITITLLLALFVLLGGGVWVALSLLGVGIIGMELFGGAPAGSILASTSWASSASWTLTALPLFIWMGEILYRTRLSEDMFNGLAPWMRGMPGRLLQDATISRGRDAVHRKSTKSSPALPIVHLAFFDCAGRRSGQRKCADVVLRGGWC